MVCGDWCIITTAGHVVLSIPSNDHMTLHTALALIICGYGFLKLTQVVYWVSYIKVMRVRESVEAAEQRKNAKAASRHR